MQEPQQPVDEVARIDALRGLRVLDTPPEERFDRITRLAQKMFDVPIALISLVDVNRQWFKSRIGLDVTETARRISFCGHAVLQEDTLVIPDAQDDPRFAGNPLVTGDPFIRFYAGRPLKSTDGHNLGTLCIIDRKPRQLTASDLLALKDLAVLAENELNSIQLNQALALRRESEARVQAVLDNVIDGVVTVDEQGMVQTFNPAAEKIFGYSPGEVIGHNVKMLMPEPYHSKHDGYISRYLRIGRAKIIGIGREMKGRRRDGSTFPMDVGVGELQLGGQRLFIGTVRDVSRQAAAEEAERAANERYGAVLRTATAVSIIGTGPDGTIKVFNEGAENMLGYRAGEMIDRLTPMVIHDPAEVAARAAELGIEPGFEVLVEAARRGEVESRDWTYLRKDGSRLAVLLSVKAMRDANGKLNGFIAVGRDVTARKHAEAEAARQSDEADRAHSETRAILDATDEAIVLISAESRFLTVNRRFSEIFGVRSERVLGRRFEDLAEEVDDIFADPAGFRALVEGTPRDSDTSFRQVISQRSPTLRELELVSTPVRSAEGAFLGRLYVFRDVTQEREVDRMKTEFVSLVSHELRTPLTSIKGFTDLILDGDAGDINDDQREYLDIVKLSADSLIALINDLLDISRIESGRIQLNKESVQLKEIIEGVAAAMAPQVQQKGQTLLVRFESDLPQVFADRDRLKQVVTNLVSNAFKYTPAGGTIQVRASRDEKSLHVSVVDTGIGISPEDQKNLFTKFYRVDSSLTREIGGTGLGLAIVKSIVELHDGTVSVESEIGKGSTFSFSLPL